MCHIAADTHAGATDAYTSAIDPYTSPTDTYACTAHGHASPTHGYSSTYRHSRGVANRDGPPEPFLSGLYLDGLRRRVRTGDLVWRPDREHFRPGPPQW